MNFLELETYLALADTLNLSKAAENLFVSQSTVTHRLKNLEKELDYPLFIRQKGKRTIELTIRGEEFMSIAQRWISLYREMETLKTSYSSALSIASIDSVILTILPAVLKEISRKEYGLNVNIQTQHTSEIYELVRKHEADIGFVSWLANPPEIIAKPVFSQKYVLIMPSHSPGRKGNIHPRDLNPSMEIALNWGYDYLKWHDYWWPVSVTPHIKIDSISALLHFLDNENYWAIVRIGDINTILKDHALAIYDITDGPSEWVGYEIRHKYPSKKNIAGINIFDRIFHEFINETSIFSD